jgi:hypothetical protein
LEQYVEPLRILAIDPGGTTGWALADSVEHVHGDSIRSTGQCDSELVWQLLSQIKPKLIVYERFDYRPMKIKVDLTPVEVIGVIKEYARQQEIPTIPQGQAEPKFSFDNKELRELGAYQTALPHANDAIRQLFYYMEFGRKKK